jgi:hypothetical protein
MMIVDHADRAASKPNPIYGRPIGVWVHSFRGRPSHNVSMRTQTNPTTPANKPINTSSESISLPLFSPSAWCDGMNALPPGVDRWWILWSGVSQHLCQWGEWNLPQLGAGESWRNRAFEGSSLNLQTGTSTRSDQEAGQCIQTDPPPYPFG